MSQWSKLHTEKQDVEYLGFTFLYLDYGLAVSFKSQSVADIGVISNLNLKLMDIVEV